MTAVALKTVAIPKVRRVRVYTRLSHAVRKRLAEYCAAAGRSERSVIEDAVDRYLDARAGDSPPKSPIERLIEAFDRDERRRDQMHRNLEILSEAFGRFLRVWMVAHAETFQEPTTPGAAEAFSKRVTFGEGLYQRLAATIARHFVQGHRFSHDLPNIDAPSAKGPEHRP